MGKLDKEQEARMAGMAYALGIAEKKGIDGLKKRASDARSIESWTSDRQRQIR